MAQQPGFEIKGRLYPFPASFRLGDAVLVTEVTSLSWPVFTERLDDPDYENDLVMLAGLVAVAIWQRHDNWSRDRVTRYVQSLPIENLEMVGDTAEPEPGDPDAEGDAGPPDQGGASSSETPPTPSSPPPDSPSEEPSPSTSGGLA